LKVKKGNKLSRVLKWSNGDVHVSDAEVIEVTANTIVCYIWADYPRIEFDRKTGDSTDASIDGTLLIDRIQKRDYILYDARFLSDPDRASVCCCAHSLKEARRDKKEFFNDSVIVSYVEVDGELIDERMEEQI
jgi:RNase P/RNase MRP subunit p29